MNEAAVKQAFKLMSKVWGTREERSFVFLPWIKGDSKTTKQRRNNYKEGKAFPWPEKEGEEQILQHMLEHRDDDLYWCPNVFLYKRRISNWVDEENSLWADLDEQDPREISEELQPTIAWETSPGRYQGIWLLEPKKYAFGASATGGLNQRLTYYLDADLSGWDATQLLRPPGWQNHKPEYREEYGEPPQGELLWARMDNRYDPEDLDEFLPPLGTTHETHSDVLDHELNRIDRAEVYNRVKSKLSRTVQQLIHARDTSGDRSKTLFHIERSLAEAGCSVAEIVALVRPTVWNKFEDRNDELKQLSIEASKAISKTHRKEDAEESDFEVIQDQVEAIGPAQPLYDIVEDVPRPKWLVKDIWTRGSVGFINGSPKTFKSFTAIDLMLSIASGAPFLNVFRVVEPGPVLYIQEEDDLATLKEHLVQVSEGKPDKYRLTPYAHMEVIDGVLHWCQPTKPEIDAWVMRGATITDDVWLERIDEQLSLKPYKLLVLDPMGMTISGVEQNSYGDMNEYYYRPLKQLAVKYEVAIILVHHTTKSDEKTSRRGTKMMGSQAGFGWQQDALHIDRKGEQMQLKIQRDSKNSRTLNFGIKVRFDGGHIWSPEIEWGSGTTAEGKALDEDHSQSNGELSATAAGRALEQLGPGPHSISVIAEAAAHEATKQTIYQQLHKLKNNGHAHSPKRGFYAYGKEADQ